MTANKRTVLIIREGVAESIVKDVVSTAALLGSVGIGIWVGSTALQWVAGIIWIIWMFAKAASALNKEALTVDEARQRLNDMERAK